MTDLLVGVDIGGTKLAVVLADFAGNIHRKKRAPTHAEQGPESVLSRLFELVRNTIGETEVADIAGFGISCGGPLDSESGIIYSPPNLPGWDAIPLKERFEKEFGFQAWVENDANAGALAEWRFGAGRNLRNVVYMTMGTGIGGGLVLDGRLYRGTNDLAGEFGHQILVPDGPLCGCGKRGCLEALCSGPAIARRARMALKQQGREPITGDRGNLTAEVVFELARGGDSVARQVVETTGYYLGWGIANLLHVINPELVAIGTLAVHGWDLLEAPLNGALRQHAWPRTLAATRVVPSSLGEAVGDLAAVAVALDHLQCDSGGRAGSSR